MGSTITRSATAVLMAGALAFAAATPTSAASGHGGGGGGRAFVDGGGSFGGVGAGVPHAGGFGGSFQSAPAGSFHPSAGFSGSGVAAGFHPVNPGFLPGQAHVVPGRVPYAYQHGHRRGTGYGGNYGYGGGGYDGGNPYCTPYWLSINPNLCYSGS